MILYDRKLTNSISTHRPLCPMSSGASDQSQGASERAQRSAIAKRAVRSKRMSEQCGENEQADERMAQHSTRRFVSLPTVPIVQWKPRSNQRGALIAVMKE